jgi:hypothetical protein
MTSAEEENLDVAFFGVNFVSIPSALEGLEVTDAEATEIPRAASRFLDEVEGGKAYALLSGGERHVVCAAGITVGANRLDYRETELDFMAFVKPGERLVRD